MEGGVQRGHFKHRAIADCSYNRATENESAAHRLLTVFVANYVTRQDGWEAGMEVARKGWRADVLAAGGWTVDPEAVFARAGNVGREIVFEIQHSRQSPALTRRRTQKYLDAGCEVLWLFDPDSGNLGSPCPCVEVRHTDGTYVVSSGVWSPGGRRSHPIPLTSFLASLLDGDVVYRSVPPGRTTRWPAPATAFSSKMAWVRGEDQSALQRALSTEERRTDRHGATVEVMARLAANGWWTDPPRIDFVGTAYATLVHGNYGTVAVHPYPRRVDADSRHALSGMKVVIARNESERRLLAVHLAAATIVLLKEFAPSPFVAPPRVLGAAEATPPPSRESPPPSPRYRESKPVEPGVKPEAVANRPAGAAHRRSGLLSWLAGRLHRKT